MDTTQATASNRVKVYVNGTQVSSFATASYPSQNLDGDFANAVSHLIGDNTNFNNKFDGYLAEVFFIDGTAHTASDFGETKNGVWVPKNVTSTDFTMGTNGFYLTFEDDTAVESFNTVLYRGTGTTQSITGMGFQPDLVWVKRRDSTPSHNLSDSVRGASQRLFSDTTAAEDANSGIVSFDSDGFTVDGARNATGSNGSSYVAWAWDAGDSDPVSNTDGSITSTVKASQANGFSIVSYQGTLADANIGHGLSSAPDMIIIKNRNRTAGTNWVVYHSALGASQRLILSDSAGASSSGNIFGSTPTAPDSTKFYVGNVNWVNNNVSNENDHIAYCWHDVTGKQKFGSYTGDGTTSNSITGLGFRPGFLMVKRTDSADNWAIYDGSRDPLNPAEQYLLADSTQAEATFSTAKVTFDSDGFTWNGAVNFGNANGGTYIYAAFAGSYSDYITDYNTDGSIDSRVKANDTTGFSIVSYTGNNTNSTIGHGLSSSAPDMIIAKSRSGAFGWGVYHSSVGYTKYLNLETTGAATTGAVWGTAAPTTSVFSISPGTLVNQSGGDYIAYCWSEKANYSSFGSYTGNGSTSGPTVTTNFNPACLIVKRTDTTGNWFIWDNTRDTDGVFNTNIHPNSNVAEAASGSNFVTPSSTGFQLTGTGAETNASGGTYIYAAFADTREAAFWLDQSGNDNDWQPVNLDHNDTVADSPTDNFCTLNPLSVPSSPSRTFSDGNLRFDATADNAKALGTILLPTSGQWYWEATQLGGTTIATIGVADANYNNTTTGRIGYRNDALKIDETNTTSSYGETYQSGDTIGVAFDADADTLTFYKNGVSQGTAFTGMAARSDNGLVPFVQAYITTPFAFNFGQQPFKYDPPA